MTADTAAQIGPTNNEVGIAWTAYILGELYTDWPRRRDFNWMDVGRAIDVSPRVEPEEMFDELLMWLRDNGYVAFDQAVDENALDVALTDRGFAALGKRAIENEPSLGSRRPGRSNQPCMEDSQIRPTTVFVDIYRYWTAQAATLTKWRIPIDSRWPGRRRHTRA
jgi:hypothetical protein